MSESRQIKPSVQTPSAFHGLCLCLLLLSAAALGLWHVTPAALPPQIQNLAPNEFSVARAQPLLAEIARQAHPTGTSENRQVADYLQAQLLALGLQTQVQEGMGFSSWSLGRVRNIVARLPSKLGAKQAMARGSAVLLMAHYDAAPNSFGAADDGASVAAVLETLRALKNGPPLVNDVLVLFTDGEEAGMLGAQLFSHEHPWLQAIGLVLNFEYRGNRGPFWMYETSPGNGKLIQGLQQALPHAHANSVLYEVYKTMPNYTDFTQFKQIALPGLNFAAIEGHNSYHTPLDTAANLDLASWQDEGQTMLALVRYFGNQDLHYLQSENRLYFDLPLVGLLSYSSNWPWTALLGMLLLCCLVKAHRLFDSRLHLRWRQSLLAVPAVVLTTMILAALCFAVWQAVLWLHPGYRLQVHGSIYNQAWYLTAMIALAVLQLTVLHRLWQKWLSASELLAAACLLWFVLALTCSVFLPGAALIFTWPLLPVLVVWLALLYLPMSTQTQAIAWSMAAWLGIVFLTPLLHLIFIALTPWNRRVFSDGKLQRPLPAIDFGGNHLMWVATAKDKLTLAPPAISVISDRVVQQRRGLVRSIELQIASSREAPMLRLELAGGKVFAVQIQGHRMTEHLDSPWHVNTYGLGQVGMHVVVEMEVGSKLHVRALDRSYQLPANPLLPARPAHIMAVAFSDSDSSAAFQELDL
ncbi:MAG: M28 family peptidase [Burkholderiales bacterium]|nr:M28 family peptidase [Burkholderiales bacterium]